MGHSGTGSGPNSTNLKKQILTLIFCFFSLKNVKMEINYPQILFNINFYGKN